MDVPHALGEAIESRCNIAILAAGSVVIVAHIEDQPDVARVGQPEEDVNLIRRLDIARAVMMENRSQACLIEDRFGNQICAAGEGLPFGRAQTHFRRDAPAILVRTGSVPLSSESTRKGAGAVATAASRRAVFTALATPAAWAAEYFMATGTNAPSMARLRFLSSALSATASVGM